MGKHIVGNWKINGAISMADALISVIVAGVPEELFAEGGLVAVCPPFPYLSHVGKRLESSPIALGAQNVQRNIVVYR
ncbi:MAG: triose-phosphate isomerase [SAR324 cluster bacterium]|nr:triose-phosphate isomerase [SAR324 cluster bacterium]